MKKVDRRNTRPTAWLQRDVTNRVLTQFCDQFGLPNDPQTLVHMPSPDPDKFQDSEQFRSAYWQAEMWSKYPFNIDGIDRKAAAMASFHEYELRCAHANERLCDLWNRPIPEGTRRVLRYARRLLHYLFRDFSLDEVVEHCSWGPGASTSMPRSRATPQNKWVLASHITEDALPWFYSFCNWSGRVFPRPTVVEGNKVVSVPKNAKTERTIAIEPDWNSFFQLGLGGAIRRRLQRRFGLLQPYAQRVNQLLAREGSVSGFLATIDLKGASDGVSLALVEALVPPDVFRVIRSLRSPKGVLEDGTTVTYEKVSSMGNGFTFELETAIFYCLARAASGHAVVYGDDIIVTATAYTQVVDVLTFCGFVVNGKKSFYTGPFRESCGGHYFRGVDVTPPYVRRPLKGPARLSLCNRISELCDNGYWRDSIGFPMWKATASGIPRFMQGPSYVDGVLHVSRPSKLVSAKSLYTFKGTRLLESFTPEASIPDGGLLQSLWDCGETTDFGRYRWQRPPGRPSVRFTSWVGAWQGVSPWSCCTSSVT